MTCECTNKEGLLKLSEEIIKVNGKDYKIEFPLYWNYEYIRVLGNMNARLGG
jgi:hypothetical protein